MLLCNANVVLTSWLDEVAPLPARTLPVLLGRSSSTFRRLPRVPVYKPPMASKDALIGSKAFRLQGDEDEAAGINNPSSTSNNTSAMSSLGQIERIYAVLEKAAEYYSARLLMVRLCVSLLFSMITAGCCCFSSVLLFYAQLLRF